MTGDLKGRIIATLGNPEEQQILSLVSHEAKTSSAIATALGLPPSTVYRKIGQMRKCGLLLIDRFFVGPDGKREALYACAFTEIRLKTDAQGLALEVVLTQKAIEKRWFETFFSSPQDDGRPDWQP